MNAALHVAHGRGLPVPTTRVEHTPRRRESSAPPFLRRSAEELAALDAGPVKPTVIVTSTPETVRKPRKPKAETGPKKPRWPVLDEQAIIAAYLTGMGQHAVGRQFNTSADRVRGVLTKHGIPLHKNGGSRRTGGRPATPIDHEQVVLDYKSGDGLQVIAKRHRCHPDRIRHVLKEAGVPIRVGHQERQWSDTETADILAAYAKGVTLTDLAAWHSTGRLQIRRLLDAHEARRPRVPEFDAEAVAAQYAAGDSLLTLSRRHGINKNRVRQVVIDNGGEIRPERGAA